MAKLLWLCILAIQLMRSAAFVHSPTCPIGYFSTPVSCQPNRPGSCQVSRPSRTDDAALARRYARGSLLRTDAVNSEYERQDEIGRKSPSMCSSPRSSASSVSEWRRNLGSGGNVKRSTIPTRAGAVLTASALAAGLAITILTPGLALAATKAVVESTAALGAADEHLHIGQKIAKFCQGSGLPDWVTLMAISAMPVVELRGGVPVGLWMGMPILKTFGLCVSGNMIPIPIILVALRSQFVQRLAKPVLDRARAKASSFGDEKSQALALTLFVGIPLPGTGAWTGAMGAFLLGIPFGKVMDVYPKICCPASRTHGCSLGR